MAKLIRWNPMRDTTDLFNEFDRFFETPLYRGRMGLPLRTDDVVGSWSLALDVAEKDDNFLVKASLPGIDPEDLNVTLEDNVLTVQGEVKKDETIEEESYHIRERRFGSFSRSLRFPVPVNAAKIEAEYENGVLTLTVPKAEEVKPKRIEIKVA
ncbi:MAG: Hsp20/alpha crystallin family protein [Anaerolineae bacterium]|nr:Hsp20/alpha crystallin family protein [Promineifilum sp.]MCZ2112584.1 Hsp20/alpha crystallin family protein [Anaerolineae bacterium]